MNQLLIADCGLRIGDCRLRTAIYWMEMLAESKKLQHFENLIVEGNELLSIVVCSIKTARSNE